MSSVKKFFDHARELKERQRIREKKYEEKMKQPQYEIIETLSKQERDYIDRILYTYLNDEDVDSIMWFIDSLNEDQTDYILSKRNTYSPQVQQAIHQMFDPSDYVRCATNKKLRYIDDYEMFKLKEQFYEKFDDHLTTVWNDYKTKNNLSRPLTEIDEELTMLTIELDKCKTDLKNYPQKFVPRNVVRPVDQKYENLKKAIGDLENEIQLKTEQIKTLDNQWDEKNKYGF